jgi:hypothetical protein
MSYTASKKQRCLNINGRGAAFAEDALICGVKKENR